MSEDFRTPEWWNKRTRENKHNLKNLIFNDDYREQFWVNVDELLAHYKDLEVADIGAGYGRFAKHFDKYTGYDFCPEMLELAKQENPDKKFVSHKCMDDLPEKVDIVFEVNCLHSFGVTREQFQQHYGKFARKAVICIERNGVDIRWIYEKTDRELG